jgi:hypothetical protein
VPLQSTALSLTCLSVILFSNLVSTLFVALLSPFFVFSRPFIRQHMTYWVKRCALPKRLDMTSVVFPPLYHDVRVACCSPTSSDSDSIQELEVGQRCCHTKPRSSPARQLFSAGDRCYGFTQHRVFKLELPVFSAGDRRYDFTQCPMFELEPPVFSAGDRSYDFTQRHMFKLELPAFSAATTSLNVTRSSWNC